MLQGYQQVNRAIGEIVATAPDNAHILLFAMEWEPSILTSCGGC